MAVRNNKVWNDFTGSNVEALMHKYDLTQVRIYAILKEQRHLHIKTKQNDLFN
jgi:Mor family transcriptional regulator